jgi:hypothetical protein
MSAAMDAVVAIAKPTPSKATSTETANGAPVSGNSTKDSAMSRQPLVTSTPARRARYQPAAGILARSAAMPYTASTAPIIPAPMPRCSRYGGTSTATAPSPSVRTADAMYSGTSDEPDPCLSAETESGVRARSAAFPSNVPLLSRWGRPDGEHGANRTLGLLV